MSSEANGWPVWASFVGMIVALLIGLIVGWFAHGVMMHMMMGQGGQGGMMNGGMMGSMMDSGMMNHNSGNHPGQSMKKSGMMNARTDDQSGHSMMSMMDGKHCSGMMRMMMDHVGAISGMDGAMGERMDRMMKSMNREEMRQHCRSMHASMKAMTGGGAKKERSQGELPEDLQSLDQANKKWVKSIRGSIEPRDAQGKQEVTVKVGAGENGLQFKPTVVKIDPGTRVRFEWTGKGGSHNVQFEDLDKGAPLQYEKEATYEMTISESGTLRYFCSPHQVVGMKGLILVE